MEDGEDYQAGGGVDFQFGGYVAAVRGHSVRRDTQTVGYLLVYQSFGHAADYILLAFAEQGELRVCGGTVRCFLLLEVASVVAQLLFKAAHRRDQQPAFHVEVAEHVALTRDDVEEAPLSRALSFCL